MTLDDYKAMIEDASVYDVAEVSPLDLAESLSQRLGNRVMMKREDLQPVFSFKLRGAYNKIAALPESEITRGVICSSAGNHAQGLRLCHPPTASFGLSEVFWNRLLVPSTSFRS